MIRPHENSFLFYFFFNFNNLFIFKFCNIFKYLYDIRWIYFEISIFLVLHFFLVGPSLNHTSANFENKKKKFCWMSL